MSWIDKMPASFINEWNDAGRLGGGRFAEPMGRCVQCDEYREGRPLERHEFICNRCAELNAERYEQMTGDAA